MGNGVAAAGSPTEKVYGLARKSGGVFSALLQAVVAAAMVYAAWCVLSYRVERLERDVGAVQSTVNSTLPEIQRSLTEIQADLRWIQRSLGAVPVPAPK